MSYTDASDVIRKAIVTTVTGLGYAVNGDGFPRVEIMSCTGGFGVDVDNCGEYVTAQLDIITLGSSPSQSIQMRTKIVEKFCLLGLSGVTGLQVVSCKLDMDEDIHESDDVNEIYRRILRFEILTHKL